MRIIVEGLTVFKGGCNLWVTVLNVLGSEGRRGKSGITPDKFLESDKEFSQITRDKLFCTKPKQYVILSNTEFDYLFILQEGMTVVLI